MIHAQRVDLLGWVFAGLAAAYLLRNLSSSLRIRLNNTLEQQVVHDLHVQVFGALQRLSISFFENRPTCEIMSRVLNDTEHMQRIFVDGLEGVITAGLTLIGIMGVLFWLNWKLALLALVPIPLLILGAMGFTKRVHGYYKEIRKGSDELNALLQDALAGIRETMGFNRQPYEQDRFGRKSDRCRQDTTNLIEEMRRVKSALEIKAITKAVERAEKAFLEVKHYIRPGVPERHLAVRLETALKKQGCTVIPFDIIVASGKNSAMPHARPSDNRIRPGDFVMFDWAGEAGGYFSDMTRTFLMKGGRDLSKKIVVYTAVLNANVSAIRSVHHETAARMVDKPARDVIKKAGYGDYFGHGTGQGVGLDVHELPRISRFGRESIRSGMVFTVEPGIYLPGLGGVRIEDMVLVERQGCRTMTSFPKKLELL